MNTTPQPDLNERIEALDRKLDLVLEELEHSRRIRREVEELKDDLARIGKDMFGTVVHELEDVAPFVRTGDFADLLKRLLRNTNTLNDLLIQLESARAFFEDASPLVRSGFSELLGRLDEMDRKGYFAMGRELARAVDNVVASFSVEDVRLLAENLVAILETVKNLTQPEMLQAINNAVEVYKNIDFDTVEEYSLWKAFREINRPEMRRGLGFMIAFLRNLSAHRPAQLSAPSAKTEAGAPHPVS
ncbi:MAG: DUF1641 domain-containing protein [Verrucomicrobia bacterium]|nr:MAG: DUF1641 domain-containing protein [Verrucomicrobiota bacterium]